MKAEPTIDPKLFRNILGNYATGVSVVTCRDGQDRPVGMTINSFASLSLSPPMVLWSIDKGSDQFEAFQQSQFYAVNILCDSHEQLSGRFATGGIDRFSGIEYAEGIERLPLLSDCCATLQCKIVSRHEAGDHIILIGEILDMSATGRAPLIFHGGRYRALA